MNLNHSMQTTWRTAAPSVPLSKRKGRTKSNHLRSSKEKNASEVSALGASDIGRFFTPNVALARVSPVLVDNLLEEEIEASKSILELQDNWDDEGSPGYTIANWERATNLVRKISYEYRRKFGHFVKPPKIYNGPQGSIDVLWKLSNRKVLINIPANEDEPGDFFGSDGAGDEIQGEINHRDQSKNLEILQWLNQ